MQWRVHKNIKTTLIIKKLEKENEKDLDQNNIVKDINVVYNNAINLVIKATPKKVFFSTKEKLLKIIKKNVVEYYIKKNKN